MKVTLKQKEWVSGGIVTHGTRQAIHADSACGAVTLVYERSNPRNPRAYTFKGLERRRENPASQFAGDLPIIVEHLPWDALPRSTWQRAMAEEQLRRSCYE